ncbi:radical SAM protein [Candidatus Woesearchaeota archaeon]|nr:MAG: radical SAM protein [Candidatus Woesearchaeota archaeon]
MTPQEIIERNNKEHIVDKERLKQLLGQAKDVFKTHHSPHIHFERSIFINWTCGIADCKYCYLSTKPKHTPGSQTTAKRSQASILAEALICKLMGWKVGYITGGLRVESTDELIDLSRKLEMILGHKIMMNFGPFSRSEVEKLSSYITGMGSAIESFNEELHNFICPSKPLRQLLQFLEYLEEFKLKKIITIILGMGEQMGDVDEVIAKVEEYNIDTVQLCFLKPQENTIFAQVPPPDMYYMAWWAAKLRIAHPHLKIKVALVHERIDDFHLLLDAGINAFSRFMIFSDFAQPFAQKLVQECAKGGRKLKGNFLNIPTISLEQEVNNLAFDEELKSSVLEKAQQYLEKLKKLEQSATLSLV